MNSVENVRLISPQRKRIYPNPQTGAHIGAAGSLDRWEPVDEPPAAHPRPRRGGARMTAPTLFPLLSPTVPGYVHGIVSVDPPMVQCDGCGVIAQGDGSLNLLILTCGILFNSPSDGRRLCRDCAAEAGWKE